MGALKRKQVKAIKRFKLKAQPEAYQLSVHFNNLRSKYSDYRIFFAFKGMSGNYMLQAQLANMQQYYGISTVRKFWESITKKPPLGFEWVLESEFLYDGNDGGDVA